MTFMNVDKIYITLKTDLDYGYYVKKYIYHHFSNSIKSGDLILFKSMKIK